MTFVDYYFFQLNARKIISFCLFTKMADSKFIVHGSVSRGESWDKSFSELIYQQLKAGGHKVAQVHNGTGESITYISILQQACNLATSLRKFGVKKGDVVCISSENRFEFSICAIAIMLVGGVNATLNILYSKEEIIHAMGISQPKIVICSDLTLKNIIEATKDVPSVGKLISLAYKTAESNITLYKDLVKAHVDVDKFKVTEIGIHEPFAVLCSSGTTGLPKGVTLNHQNVCFSTFFLKESLQTKNKNHCSLMLMPWFHAYGFVTHLAQLTFHMKYVFLVRFEEEVFLKAFETYKITLTMLAPPLMVFLAKHPLVDKYDLSSLQEIRCGGAPLYREIQEAVTERIGCEITQGYGLTEATLAVTSNDASSNKCGSCGKVIYGLQTKVVDTETGESLGPKKEGELCVKGPAVMVGYYRNEAATKETIDSDGWLHTGDIAYYDEDEYFFIIDRLKELIKYKAFQVPPAELEALILQYPKVKDVGVVGLPDEASGELPLAFVAKQAGVQLNEKEIIDFVASKVSYHKRLHGGVIFVDAIPKNPSGKILRRELRDYLKKIKSKSKL